MGILHVVADAAPVDAVVEAQQPDPGPQPAARQLPRRRAGTTTAFSVGGADGFLTAAGPDDELGEVYLIMAKQGSTLRGMTDALSIAISIGLQHGAPLETYVRKFAGMRFEPAGRTDDTEIPTATSIIDYVARRLALDYLTAEQRAELGIKTATEPNREDLPSARLGPVPAATTGSVEASEESGRRAPAQARGRSGTA
jgi:ribonucleoside-diphosphate reductase alpha chain